VKVFRTIILGIALFLAITIGFIGAVYGLFSGVPWSDSPIDFGQALGAISALLTAWAFAGAFYAVVLQRRSIELQREQMSKQIGEVEEQTQLLADRLQDFSSINQPLMPAEAISDLANILLLHAEAGLREEIVRVMDNGQGDKLNKTLNDYLAAARKAAEHYALMGALISEHRNGSTPGAPSAISRGARKHQEIAKQLGEWAEQLRKLNQAPPLRAHSR
jgi:hypothetical protein